MKNLFTMFRMEFALGILLLSSLALSSAHMGSDYQYGMMNNNSQFYPINNYAGMMGSGMMGMMNMMTGYSGYGYGSGMAFLSWLTYLLIIALIIAAIYWLIKSADKR